MNEIIQSLYARKSVRAYTDRPVPAEVKRTVLAAAVQAPTAGGQHSIPFWTSRTSALRIPWPRPVTTSPLSPQPRWCSSSAPTASGGGMPMPRPAAIPGAPDRGI